MGNAFSVPFILSCLGARFTSKMVMDIPNVNTAIKMLYVTFAKLTKDPLFALSVNT